MSKSVRVRTTPNGDDNYIKVELKQDFDLLEILSLKLRQEDVYQNFCSNYGVVAGRVSVNNGFGLPNVKVSIFIPITPEDLQNETIRTLYPYESPQKEDKNDQGIRYNLLPNQQQSFDHTPVGTFPTKIEILDNDTTLGIHEKYYKYTTTTNEAGDFILFGIPTGNQLLHYDVDWSDVGFLSLRPYDLIERGFNKNLFMSPFKFSSSPNLDNLPQLQSQNFNVLVEPFWCDDLSTGRVVGITRKDIAITTMDLTPSATFFGSVFSDDEKDSVNKQCRPRRKTGRLGEVITTSGKLEAIRRTVDGVIEKYDIPDDALDDNGNWALQLPMNIRKVVTDEFGNLIPSPDGVSGIATEGDYRFRIGMDKTNNDKRLRQRAKYLVPNMSDNYNFGTYPAAESSIPFNINEQLSTDTVGTAYSADTTNQYNYLEDFFTFRWKKVYTIRQFIGRYQSSKKDGRRTFVGIKDIEKAEGVNKFPFNRLDTHVNPLYSVFCVIMNFVGIIFSLINWIILLLNSIITMLCQVKIPVGICAYSLKGGQMKLRTRQEKCDNGGSDCVWNDGNWVKSGPDNSDDHFVWTHKCYDAKTECDDVSQVGTCTGDLRDCYDEHPVGFYFDAWTYPQNGLGPCYEFAGGWCFGQNPTSTSPLTFADGTQRYAFYGPPAYPTVSSMEAGTTNDCRSCDIDPNPNCPSQGNDCCDGELKFLGSCWSLKMKCLLAGIFCKDCGTLCPGPPDRHTCCACHFEPTDPNWPCGGDNDDPKCNAATCDGIGKCCLDCCIKIPMIELKCAEDSSFNNVTPSILGTPFAGKVCNTQTIKGICKDCAGSSLPFIGAWVQCMLEPTAAALNMLKFDFYNDWVNGSLYFPLFKRKYKVRKSKKKAGQIKSDKFCDFDCGQPLWLVGQGNNFQVSSKECFRVTISNPTSSDVTVRIKKHNIGFTGSGQWCDITLMAKESRSGYNPSGGNTTGWVCGDLTDNSGPDSAGSWKSAKRDAYSDLSIQGTGPNGDTCSVNLNKLYKANGGPKLNVNDFADLPPLVVSESSYIISSEHDKPKYIEVEDPITGIRYQKNFGGHGHHKNNCGTRFRVERKEYWQPGSNCVGPTKEDGELTGGGFEINEEDIVVEEEEEEMTSSCDLDDSAQCEFGSCRWGACRCKKDKEEYDGNRPCCNCNPRYNERSIDHGIIKFKDDVLYYASVSKDNATTNEVKIEYKSNLLFPTNICEVGSSVFCDIDEIPFVIDQIPPTTFSISEEAQKYNEQGNTGGFSSSDPINLTEKDKDSASININGYTSFGCFGAKCLNTQASVNQSQIGVDTIDRNDIGLEIGKCKLLFDHDEEIREYFCRRFSGYKNQNLDVHYQRPGSTQYDNVYNIYPPGVFSGSTLWYSINDGVPEQGTINDEEEIIFGDRCGIQYNSYEYNTPINGVNYGTPVSNQIGDIDYFYGLAPFITSGSDLSFAPVFPTYNGTSTYGPDTYGQTTTPSINIDSNGGQEERGINFATSQTPYYFYFGIVKGKTALHKVVSKYFADKIDETTLEKLSGEKRNNQSNFKNVVKNPLTLYKTCLGASMKSTK